MPKQAALALIPGYAPGAENRYRRDRSRRLRLMKMGLWIARQGEYISDFDVSSRRETSQHTKRRQANRKPAGIRTILTGLGARSVPKPLWPRRNATRIQHMLKTGKALRTEHASPAPGGYTLQLVRPSAARQLRTEVRVTRITGVPLNARSSNHRLPPHPCRKIRPRLTPQHQAR